MTAPAADTSAAACDHRGRSPREKLTESPFCKSILQEGEARGRVLGRTQTLADLLVRQLTHHLGSLDPAVREHLRSNVETLDVRVNDLLLSRDATAAQDLLNKILASMGR